MIPGWHAPNKKKYPTKMSHCKTLMRTLALGGINQQVGLLLHFIWAKAKHEIPNEGFESERI